MRPVAEIETVPRSRCRDKPWLAAGSALTGIGFTMALFVAQLAFGSDLLDSVKLGIFAASIVSAAEGMLAWCG